MSRQRAMRREAHRLKKRTKLTAVLGITVLVPVAGAGGALLSAQPASASIDYPGAPYRGAPYPGRLYQRPPLSSAATSGAPPTPTSTPPVTQTLYINEPANSPSFFNDMCTAGKEDAQAFMNVWSPSGSVSNPPQYPNPVIILDFGAQYTYNGQVGTLAPGHSSPDPYFFPDPTIVVGSRYYINCWLSQASNMVTWVDPWLPEPIFGIGTNNSSVGATGTAAEYGAAWMQVVLRGSADRRWCR